MNNVLRRERRHWGGVHRLCAGSETFVAAYCLLAVALDSGELELELYRAVVVNDNDNK